MRLLCFLFSNVGITPVIRRLQLTIISLSLNLLIIWSINQLIIWSTQKGPFKCIAQSYVTKCLVWQPKKQRYSINCDESQIQKLKWSITIKSKIFDPGWHCCTVMYTVLHQQYLYILHWMLSILDISAVCTKKLHLLSSTLHCGCS